MAPGSTSPLGARSGAMARALGQRSDGTGPRLEYGRLRASRSLPRPPAHGPWAIVRPGITADPRQVRERTSRVRSLTQAGNGQARLEVQRRCRQPPCELRQRLAKVGAKRGRVSSFLCSSSITKASGKNPEAGGMVPPAVFPKRNQAQTRTSGTTNHGGRTCLSPSLPTSRR